LRIAKLAAALALAAAAAQAGETESDSTPADRAEAELSTTVRGERRILLEPQSIGVLNADDIHRNEGVFLDDSINLIPGVRFESRTVSGGQRITIRGYGNSTNFNGTGYKAYIDGIPITDAEGTTILDDVDASTLRRIEVIKGPASSLYGQGIGGVVRFFTLRPGPGTSRFTQDVIGGSESLLRTNTRYEYGSDNASVVLNYGHQHSDGYRIHSLSKKDYVLLSGDYRPNSQQSISVYAAYNHSFDQLAGQLTEGQFLANQNFAEPPYLANDGHVTIDSARLGVSHRYEFVPSFSNTTSAYATGYQLNQPFAVGLSDNLALNVGGRTEFELRFGDRELGVSAVVGSEIEATNSFKKSYGLTNGVVGGIRGDLQVRALQSSTFAQARVRLPAEFAVVAGASLNFVRYSIADRLANSANPSHLDQSGIKSFDPVLTPRLAVEKAFGSGLSAYAQVSQGFTPPGSGSVVIPQIGAVNKDLRPERGTLLEVGSKALLLDGRLSYEAALYWLRVTDKLTPQAVTDANGTVLYTMTTNAGAQNDRGVELAASYALLKDPFGPVRLLRLFGAYTYSRFRYDAFKSDNNNDARTVDYSGNRVVGVPDHVFDAGVDLISRWGAYLNTTFQYVGWMPLTFDNAHLAKSYALLNAKVGYRADLPNKFFLDAALGARNLTGSTWYTMVFLNASYGGPPPNIYLPGPSSPTVYGDISVSKSF